MVNNNVKMHVDIIGDPRKIQDRVKYTVVNGTTQTVDLEKGDYVLNDDGHYYLSLTNRANIDLDTDDYTDTSNWTDLGTDGTEGGYPEEWLNNGIFGTPLLVGENGEDLTPIRGYFNGHIPGDATAVGYASSTKGVYVKLSRKGSVVKTIIAIGKDGRRIKYLHGNYANSLSAEGGYSSFNIDYKNHIFINIGHPDTLSALGYNSVTEALSNVVFHVFYETKANNAELASNQGVIALTDAWRLEGDIAKLGVSLYQNLINKVGVNNNLGGASNNLGLVKGYYNRPYSVNELGDYHTELPQVDDSLININPYNGSRIKILPYLTISNNRAQMNLVFKEMKFDDSTVNQDGSPTDTWGDDNKFQIRDGVSVLTDDNGNTVLYGQKAIKLDRFITED